MEPRGEGGLVKSIDKSRQGDPIKEIEAFKNLWTGKRNSGEFGELPSFRVFREIELIEKMISEKVSWLEIFQEIKQIAKVKSAQGIFEAINNLAKQEKARVKIGLFNVKYKSVWQKWLEERGDSSFVDFPPLTTQRNLDELERLVKDEADNERVVSVYKRIVGLEEPKTKRDLNPILKNILFEAGYQISDGEIGIATKRGQSLQRELPNLKIRDAHFFRLYASDLKKLIDRRANVKEINSFLESVNGTDQFKLELEKTAAENVIKSVRDLEDLNEALEYIIEILGTISTNNGSLSLVNDVVLTQMVNHLEALRVCETINDAERILRAITRTFGIKKRARELVTVKLMNERRLAQVRDLQDVKKVVRQIGYFHGSQHDYTAEEIIQLIEELETYLMIDESKKHDHAFLTVQRRMAGGVLARFTGKYGLNKIIERY